MPWLAGGLATGLVSGGIGAISSSGSQHAALEQARQAAQQYLNLKVPDPRAQQIMFERYKQTGVMDPRLQEAMQQARSHLAKIQTDPSLRSAQTSALHSLQDVADRGGRSLEQDAYLQKVQSDVAAHNRGRIGAIQSRYAQQGMGQPGGLSLEAEMGNAQNETQRESDASMEASAAAQKNALQALQQEGTQAGQLRSQDFAQQSKIAQAQDDINRFNTSALNSANAANTNAQNQARMWNAQNEQDVSNRNTNVGNQQQIYNKQQNQQGYENELAKAQGTANAMNGVANQENKIGQTNANMWSGIGQGLASAGAAGQLWSDRDNKKPQDDADYEE